MKSFLNCYAFAITNTLNIQVAVPVGFKLPHQVKSPSWKPLAVEYGERPGELLLWAKKKVQIKIAKSRKYEINLLYSMEMSLSSIWA